jgi:hypothetical protein
MIGGAAFVLLAELLFVMYLLVPKPRSEDDDARQATKVPIHVILALTVVGLQSIAATAMIGQGIAQSSSWTDIFVHTVALAVLIVASFAAMLLDVA